MAIFKRDSIACARPAALALTLVLAWAAGYGDSQAADAQIVRWGAVGHVDGGATGPAYSYNKVPLTQQMHLLQISGMNWYRTGCATYNCTDLIGLAKASGINILKSIALNPDATGDEASNYATARAYGIAQATAYSQAFKFFEASNELDNWVGMKGDGSARSQYDAQRYLSARGLIRGLIDGVHSVNPSAQVLVDDAGWCHYGFLQMLWDDGVRWDVTAFHWYASQGDFEHAGCNNANVAAIHAAFGVPVWITEYNSDTSAKTGDDAASALWNANFATQVASVASKYNIGGAFVYELLDEPNLSGLEADLGIFDGNGNPKPEFQALSKVLNALSGIPMPPVSIRAK